MIIENSPTCSLDLNGERVPRRWREFEAKVRASLAELKAARSRS
jgi:hypothetical protein